MNDVYVLGNSIDSIGSYFYALRRDDDGTLYINRVESINDIERVNMFPGQIPTEFFGLSTADYFGERDDVTRSLDFPVEQVTYEQWYWESLRKFYYLDPDNGELIVSIASDKPSKLV